MTVMTDVTEQKRAEEELASKEAELHVALDNMPGALIYTDEDLNIVFCNDRFREMYPVPAELLRTGGPIRIFYATWRRTATTARATLMTWWRGAWKACAIRPTRASRTRRPTAGTIAFGGARCFGRSRHCHDRYHRAEDRGAGAH